MKAVSGFLGVNPQQKMNPSQKIRIVRALAVVATLGVLAITAPIVWAAVSAGAGVMALAGMAVVGMTTIQAFPLAMQKLENRLLAARKAEARRNPIEQLQNEMMRRAERLKSFRKALVIVGGQIESIGQMVAERRHRDPEHELHRQERALQRLQQFHGVNLQRLGQAQMALEEFGFTVERKESEWIIAMALAEANDLVDPHASDNLVQDLLMDTALRAVQDRFNSVFAELDVQMGSLDGPTRGLLDPHTLDHMDALHLPRSQHARGTP